jgi:hypothetical protein
MKNTDKVVTGEGKLPRVEKLPHMLTTECASIFRAKEREARASRVSDLGEQFQLVSDSQDIIATLDSIGQGQEFCEVGCLFVEVLDDDYGQVYYCEQSVPYLADRVYKLQ